MQRARLPGDLWLVANVGEEGLGDLCGMRAVVDRFGEQPLAYLVVEGMTLGQIYNRGLGVRRYRLTVRTAGGHSWVDYGCPSAVHELAALTAHLADAELPKSPRTTLNAGTFHGGTSVNTIAAEAHMDIDLRSEDASTLNRLAKWVESQASAAQRPGVQVSAEVVGDRPSGEIDSQHPLVRLACKSLEKLGIQPRLNIGSTDANIPLSRGLPAICLGLTTGTGAHSDRETIQTRPLSQGLAQLTALVRGLYREASPGGSQVHPPHPAKEISP
jgi:di/tripeptidase